MKLSLVTLSTRLGRASIPAVCLAGAACRTTALAPPATFAEMDGGDYAYRASSAEGVVVAARSEPNDPGASLEFWSRAADRRLRHDGYAPDASVAVASADGLPGRQLRYTRVEAGLAYRYWLTLFVTPDRVYLVEAGGDDRDFEPARADVERAVLSLRRK